MFCHKTTRAKRHKKAPQVGFEPTTDRLTADCSTTELLWNKDIKMYMPGNVLLLRRQSLNYHRR